MATIPVTPVTPTGAVHGPFGLAWEERDGWLLDNFIEPAVINLDKGTGSKQNLTFFPAIAFLYKEASKYAKDCRYDGDRFAFPFKEDQLDNIWYVSKYGPRGESGKMHKGIDLATGQKRGVPFHAIDDGTVVVSEDYGPSGGQTIVIKHQDDYYSTHYHADERQVNVGDSVYRGQQIGLVGDTGPCEPGAVHLHIEVSKGGYHSDYPYNPTDEWPLISDMLGDGAEARALSTKF